MASELPGSSSSPKLQRCRASGSGFGLDIASVLPPPPPPSLLHQTPATTSATTTHPVDPSIKPSGREEIWNQVKNRFDDAIENQDSLELKEVLKYLLDQPSKVSLYLALSE